MSFLSSKDTVGNILLVITALGLTFAVAEVGYRLIDPYPYFSPEEINNTKHANLSQYDAILGWKGTPRARQVFVTENAKVSIEHNRLGHRDIEPERRSARKPAIVFLGDSFTWGYEVNFEEMFVNRLREKMSTFELFNLTHRGYGTDQSLLTFRHWQDEQPLRLVVLMFSENDHPDNDNHIRYGRSKPKFEIVDGRLVLGNVPVPFSREFWDERLTLDHAGKALHLSTSSLMQQLKYVAQQSHAARDIWFRIRNHLERRERVEDGKLRGGWKARDFTLTKRIIEDLRSDVVKRNAQLLVVAIPSKMELVATEGYVPYQGAVQGICAELGIEYLDLAPYFKRSWLRTFFRWGIHWNRNGHAVAAKVLYGYLKTKGY